MTGITSRSPFILSAGLATAGVLDKVRADGTVFQRVVNPSNDPIVIGLGSLIGKFVCNSGQDRLFPFGPCTDTTVNNSKTIITGATSKLQESCQNVCQTSVAKVQASEAKPSLLSKPGRHSNAFPPTSSASFLPSRDLDFTQSDLSPAQCEELRSLVDGCKDVFVSPDGKVGEGGIINHTIEFDPKQRPIKHWAYRLAPKEKEKMEKLLADSQNQDIIEPSVSPWAAPCFLVNKKNKAGSGFVVDYRISQ